MKRFLPIIIILFLVAGLGGLIFKVKSRPAPSSPTEAEQSGGDQADVNIAARIIEGDGKLDANLQIYLVPTRHAPARLTAFTIDGVVESVGEIAVKTGRRPAADDGLDKEGWKFPFLTVDQAGNNRLEVKLAAIYLSDKKFMLTGETSAVTIPLEDSFAGGITFSVNRNNTVVYGGGAEPYPLAGQKDRLKLTLTEVKNE